MSLMQWIATGDRHARVSRYWLGLAVGWLLPIGASAAVANDEQTAKQILDASGIRGGLVVHLGCGDGRLTAALHANDSYVVQGLDADVTAARRTIQSLGLYGKVTAEPWTGDRLPYVDNLATLIVVCGESQPARGELLRVLAPNGAVVDARHLPTATRHSSLVTLRKPWPKEIDEWTHFLHGPDNNPVAHDASVAPPKHLQWAAGPRWARSHEIAPSIMGMVSAAGRMFYVHDTGPIGTFDKRFPEKWVLVARDAFNGAPLWERPLDAWTTSVVDWLHVPVDPNRRLVAATDAVYAALGGGRPVTAFAAATGQVLRRYPGTESAREIVLYGGVLLVVTRDGRPRAVDIENGRGLWQADDRLFPLTLAAQADATWYRGDRGIVCRDLLTGKERWRREGSAGGKTGRRVAGAFLTVCENVVLNSSQKGIDALDATDGRDLWSWEGRATSFRTPWPIFVADGLVWPGVTGLGLDPRTGEIKRKAPLVKTAGHHHRCYLQKATDRFLLASYRGVEFMPLQDADKPSRTDWTRGTCRLGVIPCNGLLYCPQTACFCYPDARLQGMNALASARREPVVAVTPGERLERGPAFSEMPNLKSQVSDSEWPTYRHDPTRSGASPLPLPETLSPVWTAELDAKVTPPVVAAGKVFVATIDTHQVHALDAASGALAWSYTAGGRVDSPPTFHGGRLLFGCRDGWVYCLRASDGALCWRFLAAAADLRVGAFDQIESAWPVHGSVLVRGDVVYFAAGRSSFLDGGIRLYALDSRTGDLLHQGQLADRSDDVKSVTFSMGGALADILVADGRNVYMSRHAFDAALAPLPVEPYPFAKAAGKGVLDVGLHLMTTSGFLDDTCFNRTFWTYSRYWPGYTYGYLGPKTGQLVVFSKTTTFGATVYDSHMKQWFRSPNVVPGSGTVLRADDNSAAEDFRGGSKTGGEPDRWSYLRRQPPRWSARVPIRVRAMLLANDRLLVAGFVDAVPADDPLAAYEGRTARRLLTLSAVDGNVLSKLTLKAQPVWDGMAAANGCLFVSCQDGSLVCLGAPGAAKSVREE